MPDRDEFAHLPRKLRPAAHAYAAAARGEPLSIDAVAEALDLLLSGGVASLPAQLASWQLCRAAGERLAGIVRTASSCDETERAKKDPFEHCGLCTSCLLRRSVLHAALGADDPTTYRSVITKRSGLYELEAYQRQAARFANVASYSSLLADDPSIRRAEDYLVAAERLDGKQARAALVNLLHRHGAEVMSFFEHVQPSCAAPIRPPARREASHDLFSSAR